MEKTVITCDVECYPNYFLVTLYRVSDGATVFFDMHYDVLNTLERPHTLENLRSMLSRYTVVTYNGNYYDLPLIYMFISGCNNSTLKEYSDRIIQEKIKPWEIEKAYKDFSIDTIDLIDLCPLQSTLKIYGGRLHTKTMQDLPLPPDAVIPQEKIGTIRKYCRNDTRITAELYNELSFNLQIREKLGAEIGVDLRSKGDAKIAETLIIKKIYSDRQTVRPQNIVKPGTQYNYTAPKFIKFESALLQQIKYQFENLPYTVADNGHVEFCFENKKKSYNFSFYGTKYTCGIGGLHSCEKSVCYKATDTMIIEDNDVTSYYPSTILNNRYFPESLGIEFYNVYKDIVVRRITAKHHGDKLTAAALKVPINACFGKFGSKYSALYAPDLMINVTVTGQLSLLMLIEMLEQANIHVISANTDGIVTYYNKDLKQTKDSIIQKWSELTEYDMEITPYSILASRDVNNYVAVKTDGHCKGKGAYADLSEEYYHLRSNPDGAISYTAVRQFLIDNTPIEKTIRACKDIRQFVTIRTVNGGAVYNGTLIGKSIRYYHASDSLESFFYSDSKPTTAGHLVPCTLGTVPCMTLPDKLPDNIDYEYYVQSAYDALTELGINV